MEEKNVAHSKDKVSKTSTAPLLAELSPMDGGRWQDWLIESQYIHGNGKNAVHKNVYDLK